MSIFSSLFGGGAASGTIDGARARELVKAGAVMLDVRTPGEFAGGSVPGALNIPVQELQARLGELDKGKTYVVFCRSGARSSAACATLRGAGFAQVNDMGSVGAW